MEEFGLFLRRMMQGVTEVCQGAAIVIGGVALWTFMFGVAPSFAQVAPGVIAVMPGIPAIPFLAAGVGVYIALRAFGFI